MSGWSSLVLYIYNIIINFHLVRVHKHNTHTHPGIWHSAKIVQRAISTASMASMFYAKDIFLPNVFFILVFFRRIIFFFFVSATIFFVRESVYINRTKIYSLFVHSDYFFLFLILIYCFVVPEKMDVNVRIPIEASIRNFGGYVLMYYFICWLQNFK